MLKPLTHSAIVSGDRMVIKIEWGHVGLLIQQDCGFMGRGHVSMWGYSGKVTICKEGREASPGTDPAGPPSFQNWENKFLLVKPPSLWNSIMAAQALASSLSRPPQLENSVNLCLNSSLVFNFIKVKCDHSLKSQIFLQVLYKDTALLTPVFSNSSSPLSFGGYVSIYLWLWTVCSHCYFQ